MSRHIRQTQTLPALLLIGFFGALTLVVLSFVLPVHVVLLRLGGMIMALWFLVAALILNRTKYSEVEARVRQAEAETLRQAAAILNSSLSLDVVLALILEQLRVAIPYDSATVQQKEDNTLVIRAARGFADEAALVHLSFSIEANLPNAEVVRTQRPLAVSNVRQAYPVFNQLAADYQALRIVSWLGVPLMLDKDVLGMITIDRNEERPFSDHEIALAVTFANHASIALRNARLYRELEAHSELLEQAVVRRTADLQHSVEQVETILNNSPDAILLLAADFAIERVNPAFERLFGYQAAEAAGASPLLLADEESRAMFDAGLQTAVISTAPQRLEFIAQRKDATTFDVSAALAPILNDDGVTAVVCSLHDVSTFKEVERMKDAFLSNISHELRTPITNLKLHLDLIRLNPQRQAVYLERLSHEVDRLTAVINSLLRLSRLDQGQVELHLQTVDLLALAETLIADRQGVAESRQISLRLETEPPLPPITADEELLTQVIGIILNNALNYTPPGGEIVVRPTGYQTAEQQWLGLSVRDTGLGIAEGEQEQVFQRFFRGQAGQSSGMPGAGLGLSIAQKIMLLHHGMIEFESDGSNTGAQFTLWLPGGVDGG